MTRMAMAAFLLAAGIGAAGSQEGGKLEYDTFCKLSIEAKRAAFNATDAETRAVLVRTQLERWRDANKNRLDDKQTALLADLTAAVTPAAYAGGQATNDAREKMRELEPKMKELFNMADLQAMQPNGPCIAKSK